VETEAVAGSTKWVLKAYAVDGLMKDALVTATTDATFVDAPKRKRSINQYNGSYELDRDNSRWPTRKHQMAGDR